MTFTGKFRTCSFHLPISIEAVTENSNTEILPYDFTMG